MVKILAIRLHIVIKTRNSPIFNHKFPMISNGDEIRRSPNIFLVKTRYSRNLNTNWHFPIFNQIPHFFPITVRTGHIFLISVLVCAFYSRNS